MGRLALATHDLLLAHTTHSLGSQPRVGNQPFHRFFNNGTSAAQPNVNGSAFRVVHWRASLAAYYSSNKIKRVTS